MDESTLYHGSLGVVAAISGAAALSAAGTDGVSPAITLAALVLGVLVVGALYRVSSPEARGSGSGSGFDG